MCLQHVYGGRQCTPFLAVGKAHWLRMRFVQAAHVMLILQGQCTLSKIAIAMRDLL
jgi:hypothetical protein